MIVREIYTLKMKAVYLVVALLAFASALVQAYDPAPLQDFCVALNDSITPRVFVNGKFCKDPNVVKAEDFFFSGLDVPRDTSNPYGSYVTDVDVNNLPGLNTLGISLERIDFGPKGLNPLHTHPRGSEIFVVLDGTLLVGFVTSNQDNNRFFSKVLKKGDVFLFPIGLIHFQYNLGDHNAVAISSLSSQNPGEISIANAVFGSYPPISDEVLEKDFQVDEKIIDLLKKPFRA